MQRLQSLDLILNPDPGSVVQRARVQGMAFRPGRAKTSWNSCNVPVVKPAIEPVKYNRHARTNASSNISATRGGGGVEAEQPVPQRLGVMQAEVLHVQHREAPGFETVHHFAQAGRIGAGKNPPLDPGVDLARLVPADGMDQSAAGGAEAAVDGRAQLAVVVGPDVLQHAHGDEGVELPADVAVVVLDELARGRRGLRRVPAAGRA